MGAPEYELSEDAALTILLHASKHPSCTVNGALLGKPRAGGGGGYAVAAAVPLFHRSHVMAPCVEAALTQAEAAAQKQGLQLLGYYHCDYKFGPPELSPLGRRIADRIADRAPAACALLLDNAKLAAFSGAPAAAEAAAAGGGGGGGGGGAAGAPLELLLRDPAGGGAKGGAWRRVAPAGGGGLSAGGGGWGAVQKRYLNLFAAGRHRDLADFDEHLDDVSRDYLNEKLLAGSELLAR